MTEPTSNRAVGHHTLLAATQSAHATSYMEPVIPTRWCHCPLDVLCGCCLAPAEVPGWQFEVFEAERQADGIEAQQLHAIHLRGEVIR